ncbi:hypothetical protein ACKI1H_29290 [Pseudomonas sp. YH-1]|uniref:hypothetical protein n=1 Tax=Pseudomonas sp. YH-1 TaxID=3384787 RepID=UPI003F7FE6E2
MSTKPSRALDVEVEGTSLETFSPLIASCSKFSTAPGMTVENCLDGSSNLLAGSIHLARLITDGHQDDAEQSAYCLSFLLEGAKALLDAANSQLCKGVKP